MQGAFLPVVPAHIRLAVDQALSKRLETISWGEKLTLAHRASGAVAGELLRDGEARLVRAALENSRLTEALIVRALMRPDASAAWVAAVCHHPQWSLRREARVALLRNEKTPFARAVEFARTMPVAEVREILQNSRLPGNAKSYLVKDLENRVSKTGIALLTPFLARRWLCRLRRLCHGAAPRSLRRGAHGSLGAPGLG